MIALQKTKAHIVLGFGFWIQMVNYQFIIQAPGKVIDVTLLGALRSTHEIKHQGEDFNYIFD